MSADTRAGWCALSLTQGVHRGVTKKHDKTIVTELTPGSFLEVTTFIADGKRKSKCKVSFVHLPFSPQQRT